MIPAIYGNDSVLELIRTMAANDHLPHASLIYGEKGMGRKTIARYFAMTALCTGAHAPCGTCANCRKVCGDIHPDVIWVEHSGKLGGFSVETVRSICRDAIVAPNDSDRKVYIFADCDRIAVPAQNTLLKLTEEPPPHVLLLFTAVHRNVFLETMLSRMIPLPVRPCTPEECRQALVNNHGCTPADAEKAVEACGGNIGQALLWLEDADMQTMTRQVIAMTEAITERKQYEMLRILTNFEKDRQQAAAFLRMLDLQLRDALVLKYGQETRTGCDRQSAGKLSRTLTAGRARRMHDAIQTAHEALQANVSTKLVLSVLGGSLLS